MRDTVTLPSLGENATEAVVVDLSVEPGQSVEEGQTLLTVEAEKVDVDVPAPRSGVVAEYLVSVDDEVEVGAPVCVLEGES